MLAVTHVYNLHLTAEQANIGSNVTNSENKGNGKNIMLSTNVKCSYILCEVFRQHWIFPSRKSKLKKFLYPLYQKKLVVYFFNSTPFFGIILFISICSSKEELLSLAFDRSTNVDHQDASSREKVNCLFDPTHADVTEKICNYSNITANLNLANIQDTKF